MTQNYKSAAQGECPQPLPLSNNKETSTSSLQLPKSHSVFDQGSCPFLKCSLFSCLSKSFINSTNLCRAPTVSPGSTGCRERVVGKTERQTWSLHAGTYRLSFQCLVWAQPQAAKSLGVFRSGIFIACQGVGQLSDEVVLRPCLLCETETPQGRTCHSAALCLQGYSVQHLR